MLADGLYLLERKKTFSLGETKDLVLPAYNDYDLQFVPNAFEFCTNPSFYWLPHFMFVGEYRGLSIASFYDTALGQPGQGLPPVYRCEEIHIYGSDIFSFNAPGVSSGTILKVSICAYVQGKAKTILRIGSTDYTSPETSESYLFSWKIKEYATKPNTGASWNWADLAAGTLKAGVYLKSDGALYPAVCRHLKVLIDYLDDQGIQQQIALWPAADISIGLRQQAENLFLATDFPTTWNNNDKVFIRPRDYNFPYDSNETSETSLKTIKGGMVRNKTTAPSGATINSVQIRWTWTNRSQVNPFNPFVSSYLKLGDLYQAGKWRWNTGNIASGDPPISYTDDTEFLYNRFAIILTLAPEHGVPDKYVYGPGYRPRNPYFNVSGSFRLKLKMRHPPNQTTKISVGGIQYSFVNDDEYFQGVVDTLLPDTFTGTPTVHIDTTHDEDNAIWSLRIFAVDSNGNELQIPWTNDVLQDLKYGIAYRTHSQTTAETFVWCTEGDFCTDIQYNLYFMPCPLDTSDLHLRIRYNTNQYIENTDGDLDLNYWTAFHLLPAMNAYLWAPATRRITSGIARYPPQGSIINSIRITYSYYALIAEDGGYCKPFLKIKGTYYYGTQINIDDRNPWDAKDQCQYTWTVNPSTGQAWTWRDACELLWGLEVDTDDDFMCYDLYQLQIKINYIEAIERTSIEYTMLQGDVQSHAQYTQRPIKADDLYFVLPAGQTIPERSEIVLVKDGVQVFHGPVWTRDENPSSRELLVKAKGQQAVLDYRYLPYFFYRAKNVDFDEIYTIEDMFSDASPEYTFFQHVGARANVTNAGGSSVPENVPSITYTQVHECKLGLFFLLHSLIPQGNGLSTGKIPGIAAFIDPTRYGLFSTNHEPTMGWPNDFSGGVHRLRAAASASCGDEEYYVSGEDLYVKGWPDAKLLLADHWCESGLIPGTFELAGKYLNVPYVFKDTFAKGFDDFFTRLGQELEFAPGDDGYLHMNSASELGRGSESDPIMQFIDGVNCSITKKIPSEPAATAIMGIESCNTCQVSADWKKSRMPILSILPDATRTGRDLRAYLDYKRDLDLTVFEIKSNEEHWLLRPYDWIEVTAKNDAPYAVRIRQIERIPKALPLRVQAGRSMPNISEKWGEWRNAAGSTDNDHQIQSKEFSFEAPTGSQTFTVAASDLASDDWSCLLKLDWSLWVASGYDAVLPAGLNLFLVLKLNNRVIPPGRIKAYGNSGNIEINITDCCSSGTNTLAVKLWNGITPDANYGHKVSGEIVQYKRVQAIENA